MDQKNWYSLEGSDVANSLETDLESGLTSEKVAKARETYGANEITSKKKKSVFQMILEQFKDFMIIVLIIAALVSGLVSKEFTYSVKIFDFNSLPCRPYSWIKEF